jgi:hypothetical protein
MLEEGIIIYTITLWVARVNVTFTDNKNKTQSKINGGDRQCSVMIDNIIMPVKAKRQLPVIEMREIFSKVS